MIWQQRSTGRSSPMQSTAMYGCGDAREQLVVPAMRKGPWTLEEDLILVEYIYAHGKDTWDILAVATGLKRTGKSCRMRWVNHLSPSVRRGSITLEEHDLIIQLHAVWGNRWSKIARHLPGRTDNDIKNYWRTMTQKKQKKDRMATNKSSASTEKQCSSTSTEEQGSINSGSGLAEATQDYGIVVPQRGIRTSLNHQGYNPHGGGGGGGCDAAMDVPPVLLGLPCENSWSFEDLSPVVQSFHSNNSAQFFQHEATQDYGIVVPQPGIPTSLDHQGYNPHAGGGEGSCDGAMDVPPEFLALSCENFWSFEDLDFWPMVQSFHSNSSTQFFEHEAI